MARRHLRKAELARERRRLALVLGPGVGVHEHDRHRIDAVGARCAQLRLQFREVERRLHASVGAHALARLDDTGVEHLRLDDPLGEDVGARLRADLELISKPARDDEQRPVALALQERVGRDRRPHLDDGDALRRDRRAARDTEEAADRFECGVIVGAGVVGQELAGQDAAVRRAGDDVGERAAAIDPEVPLVDRVPHAGESKPPICQLSVPRTCVNQRPCGGPSGGSCSDDGRGGLANRPQFSGNCPDFPKDS